MVPCLEELHKSMESFLFVKKYQQFVLSKFYLMTYLGRRLLLMDLVSQWFDQLVRCLIQKNVTPQQYFAQ